MVAACRDFPGGLFLCGVPLMFTYTFTGNVHSILVFKSYNPNSPVILYVTMAMARI
ncbi:hypothetical protein PATY110618_06380 [Paenibacillus typhae]|uniref:Uncharacterized protein n=1 Tax=Paenibacillus typhae TaxID=1174501 RepID=A0A1G8FMQ5_9BACL|nr:hypothetical protein SAMN05216192_101289 [Paenibacillus typhae]